MYYFISSLNIFAKIIKHQFKIIQFISSIVSDLDYDNETKIQSELAFYNGFTVSTFFAKNTIYQPTLPATKMKNMIT